MLNFVSEDDMIVSQNFQIDLIPVGHIFYDAPVDDDDVVAPTPPPIPPGGDPDDYPNVPKTAETSVVMRLIGVGSPGDNDPTHVFFPPEYQ